MRIEQEIRRDFKTLAKVDMRTLPALVKRQMSSTELTPLYESTKKQLAVLSNIDEIKEIADKHSAIAHYAKQIQDRSLLYYAERVYARALTRIGELMTDLKPGERKDLAKRHGLPDAIARDAFAAGHLPKRARDALIEKTPPANRHELAFQGRKLMPPPRTTVRPHHGFQRHVDYEEPFGKAKFTIAIMRDSFVEGGDWEKEGAQIIDPVSLVAGTTHEERVILREMLIPVIEWCDRLEQALGLK